MAVKPVGVGQQSGSSFGGEEGVFAAPLPTGVSLCQVVILAINYATGGSPTGAPTVSFGQEGWKPLISRAFLGGRGIDLYVKVFSGTPVPLSEQVTFKWTGATSVFWGTMSVAYDEVDPTHPVDVGECFRRPAATEITCFSLVATAAAIGGRVVNGIATNSGSGTITSKEEFQEILIPAAPGARVISQDKTNILAAGAVGVRTYIDTVSTESFVFTLVLRPGPAATEPAKTTPYKRVRSNELGSTGKTEGDE